MSRIDPKDLELEWRLFYKSAQYNGPLGDGPTSHSQESLGTRRTDHSWSPGAQPDMDVERSLSPSGAGTSVASQEEPPLYDSDIDYAPRSVYTSLINHGIDVLLQRPQIYHFRRNGR